MTYQVQYPQVEELALMTTQDVFNRAAVHLIKQGKRAIQDGQCKYRSADRSCCAVGALIPQEMYSDSFEGKGVRGLLSEAPSTFADFIVRHQSLLSTLQGLHDDNRDVRSWPDLLRRLAHRFGLSTYALERAVKERQDSSRLYDYSIVSASALMSPSFRVFGKTFDSMIVDELSAVEPMPEKVTLQSTTSTETSHKIVTVETETTSIDGVTLNLTLNEARALRSVLRLIGGDTGGIYDEVKTVDKTLEASGVGYYAASGTKLVSSLGSGYGFHFQDLAKDVVIADENLPSQTPKVTEKPFDWSSVMFSGLTVPSVEGLLSHSTTH